MADPLGRGTTSFEQPRALFWWLAPRQALFAGAFLLISLVLVEPGLERGPSFSLKAATVALGLSLLSSGGLLWAKARGRPLTSLALGQLLLDQALWSVVVYLSGGPASSATPGYGIMCLLGGIFLGVPGAIAAALGAGVFYSLVTLLMQSGALHPPPDQHSTTYELPADQLSSYVIVNLLALMLVALLVSYLSERLQRTQGELVRAENRAEEAEKLAALGRLSAGLAHEIRNPLSSISGAVQMLSTSVVDTDDRQLCDIVLRESKRLEELVNDMLDLSRSRPPTLRPTDLRVLINDVLRLSLASGRAQSDVNLCLITEDDAHPVVQADADQLRQLLWNLVRNAVQASAAGGEVRVRLASHPEVSVTVEDDGSGIDSQARLHIFDAYYTTRSQGTGIGLAVVKRIADEHGFRLRVESDQGEGARFEVLMGKSISDAQTHPMT